MKTSHDNSRIRSHISPYKRLIKDSLIHTDNDSNWLITLSDVMSLLLVFFIMFHFMSKGFVKENQSQKKNGTNVVLNNTMPQHVPADTIEKIKNEMDSAIKDLNLREDVYIQTVNKEIIITMKEKVTFSPAEAEILKDLEPMLDKIAMTIKRYPSFVVEIDGHTDNVPINTPRYPSNWELSVARAASVLKYFIHQHDIESSRLYIRGNADQRPLTTNDSPEQRAQNRRVEIRLKESESF
ncbi:MAG: OmpA family protein [Nitrospirota bacterium]